MPGAAVTRVSRRARATGSRGPTAPSRAADLLAAHVHLVEPPDRRRRHGRRLPQLPEACRLGISPGLARSNRGSSTSASFSTVCSTAVRSATSRPHEGRAGAAERRVGERSGDRRLNALGEKLAAL
jgi:hypothetical protein